MTTRALAGPALRHPLGAYLDYRADPLTLFYEQAVAHGGSVRLRLVHQQLHLLVNPDHINQVLVTNAAKYAKGISYQSLNYLLGPGLLTSGGELWKRQRALIKPAFARRHVDTEIPLMIACGQRMLDRLDKRAADGAAFDLVPEVMGFAADVVCRAVMGADIDGVLPQIEDDVREGVSWVMRHMSAPIQIPPTVPTPANRRFRGVLDRLHRVVDDVIQGHRAAAAGPADSLLSRLLAARDDAGHAMDDEQLRHEVLTFLLAGHETTGGALAWTVYELCRNPAVLQRVRAEIDAALGAGDVAGALPALELTGRAIDESMRLHPPAWAFSRTALEADSFDGFDLEPGAIVVISPFVNHRFPDFWDSPLTFDPDRFTKERNRARPPFRYFPFGWGAHLCVGQHMALTELRVGLAMLLARYDIELVNGLRVRENPEISNTPDPVLVRLTRREPAIAATDSLAESAR
ncbi:cytochrome P450 [Nocardia bhagyanarayanae]|uniref:Cytochrome P450 n=1 Tax=Nocardia bhagyanarayanae TaxID=1215925 RepID=A0A543FHC8_9NOCA|nr:cytochrome P450 [Nocardia bhagyanarayanae]TQM33225.1 cytochrome P450 [Nocardia bhagyanarayanae]